MPIPKIIWLVVYRRLIYQNSWLNLCFQNIYNSPRCYLKTEADEVKLVSRSVFEKNEAANTLKATVNPCMPASV